MYTSSSLVILQPSKELYVYRRNWVFEENFVQLSLLKLDLLWGNFDGTVRQPHQHVPADVGRPDFPLMSSGEESGVSGSWFSFEVKVALHWVQSSQPLAVFVTHSSIWSSYSKNLVVGRNGKIVVFPFLLANKYAH